MRSTPPQQSAEGASEEAKWALPAKRREFEGSALIVKETEMRLDKFLKVSRIIKRRTVANEACDAGRVTINGKQAKASVDVKTGDIIEIKFGDKLSKFEVLEVKETVRKDDASGMYQML